VSRLGADLLPKILSQELSVSFIRSWMLLLRETLFLATSLFTAILYGTMYMFFSGFPIVFQRARGWTQGTAELGFVGVTVGICFATLAVGVDNMRYVRLCVAAEAKGRELEA
jgi:hypothetical protein